MKRRYRYWLIASLFLFFIIYSFKTTAQVSVKGIPESFNLSLKNAIKIPVLLLDSVHVQRMLEEDKIYRIDNRYGIIQSCNINIKEAGVKTEVAGKGTIWQYKIESNDAFSLGILFKSFNLPDGASVFIYDSSKSQLRGAFTHQNNNSGHRLPIAEFP
jgi:lysyl endopeptidase